MILPNHFRYSEYTDAELDAFLLKWPHHGDSSMLYREQARRRKEKDDQIRANRHEENQSLGQKTLFWARIGGIAAAVGTIAVLLSDIHISKSPPSTPSQASPTSSSQTKPTVAPAQSPAVTESPSESQQASPTPELTSTPE